MGGTETPKRRGELRAAAANHFEDPSASYNLGTRKEKADERRFSLKKPFVRHATDHSPGLSKDKEDMKRWQSDIVTPNLHQKLKNREKE